MGARWSPSYIVIGESNQMGYIKVLLSGSAEFSIYKCSKCIKVLEIYFAFLSCHATVLY